jgi:hypothetical protein
MKPKKLTEYNLKHMETSDAWTLRQVLSYATETDIDQSVVTTEEALKLLFRCIKSLKYELAVARAGLRQVTRERDRLSQRDFFNN